MHQRDEDGWRRVLENILGYVAYFGLLFCLEELGAILHELDPLGEQLAVLAQKVDLLLDFEYVFIAQVLAHFFD